MEMDPAAVRRRLTAEREGVLARLGALDADVAEVIAASRDSNADDEHDPEGATIAFERAQLSALARQARDRLVEIDDAERRLEAGTYGTCERCGSAIAPERLEVRPAARLCLPCAAGP